MTQDVAIEKGNAESKAQPASKQLEKPKTVAPASPQKIEENGESAKVQLSKDVLKLRAGRKYFSLIEKVKMIAHQKSYAMMCLGDVGVGKSTVIKETLENEGLEDGKGYIKQSGFTTPMSLYETLYEHRESGKVVVIDDCDAALKNKTCLDLLKAVLDDKFQRQVSYATRRQSVDLPKSFVFAGAVIFITNYRAKENDIHFLAVQDRCLVQKMYLNAQEKLEYIEKIIVPQDYKTTTLDDRKKIFALMRECVAQGGGKFSYRTYFQLLDFYKHDPKNFDIHLREIIPYDNDLTCLLQIQSTCEKDVWQAKFMERTGKSRRTYFNVAKRLEEIFPARSGANGGQYGQ